MIVDKLILKLDSSELRESYRYILLDMLGVVSELSDLYIESLNDTLQPADIIPVKRPELLHDINSCPHLICVGKPDEDVNQELVFASVQQSQQDLLTTKQYVCGWIASELPIEELSSELTSIGEKLGALLSMRFVPFYEPFRMQLLQDSVLDSHWLSELFSSCIVYYYLDQNQELHEIYSADNNLLSRILISQNVGFFQREAMSIFRLYVMWHDINKAQNIAVMPDALPKLLGYYLSAVQLNLMHPKDRNIFVLFSMKYGDLLRSEKLKKAIEDNADKTSGQLSQQFKLLNNEFNNLAPQI